MEADRVGAGHRIEISGTMDRHAVEVLQLELRRLADRFGVEIKGLRVERLEKGSLPEFL